MSWTEFEQSAADSAAIARRRIEERSVALIGTTRRDGFPRISAISPVFVEGELGVGLGAGSGVARDVRADPRCILHAAVWESGGHEPEVKLYGTLGRSDIRAGWWAGRPAEAADVYTLMLSEALVIEWDLRAGRMTQRRWQPGAGERISERAYP